MIIIGVDPGLSGAAAAMDEDYLVLDWHRFKKLDLGQTGFSKSRMDGERFSDFLWQMHEEGSFGRCAFIESPAIVHGNMVASQLGMYRAFGTAEGVLEANGITPELVKPMEWRKAFGLVKQPKRESKARVLELHPEMREVKFSQDVAEAILIARWGLKYRIKAEKVAA